MTTPETTLPNPPKGRRRRWLIWLLGSALLLGIGLLVVPMLINTLFVEGIDMTPEERSSYAQTMFAQHPELFPEDRRQSILDGVVVLGMTPFEAKLAGGAFAYKVVADKAKWSEHSDPLKVMWAQSMQADDSEIWMIFRNSSQYPQSGDTSFRVCFKRGSATQIEKLGGELC